MDISEHRLHWPHRDYEPPERVTLFRGGIRRDSPRWEQEYVPATPQGAVSAERELLREVACAGVNDVRGLRYVEIQLDRATWTQVQKYADPAHLRAALEVTDDQ